MKRAICSQKGISQIFVLVVMAVLAIALPVSMKLVQQVQENRSKAALSCGSCSDIGNKKCVDGKIQKCTGDIDCAITGGSIVPGGLVHWTSTTETCETRFWGSDNASTDSTPRKYYFYNDSACVQTVAYSSKTACNTAVGRQGPCYDTKPTCDSAHPTKSSSGGSSGSCTLGTDGCGCIVSTGYQVPSCGSGLTCNSSGKCEKTSSSSNTGTPYTNSAKCIAKNGFCGDFSSSLASGTKCTVTGKISNGVIYTGLCGGDTTVKCCGSSCALGTEGCICSSGPNMTGVCNSGLTCNSSGMCVKTVVEQPSQPAPAQPAPTAAMPAITCEGELYREYYPDIKASGINPNYHYRDFGKNEGRIWSSAICKDNIALNCGSGSLKTETCTNGCTNGVCNAAPAPAPTAATAQKLSFKISFAGLVPDQKCLDKFKQVSVTVGKVGSTVKQDLTVNVNAISGLTNAKGYQVFGADNIALDGTLAGASNVYVKIKGQLHGKMYFCKKDQSGKTPDQVCNITLDGSANNFANYSILAGDVDHNGVINILDFSAVKSGFSSEAELTEINDGTVRCDKSNIDLNGDGAVNDNGDLRLVRDALAYRDDE